MVRRSFTQKNNANDRKNNPLLRLVYSRWHAQIDTEKYKLIIDISFGFRFPNQEQKMLSERTVLVDFVISRTVGDRLLSHVSYRPSEFRPLKKSTDTSKCVSIRQRGGVKFLRPSDILFTIVSFLNRNEEKPSAKRIDYRPHCESQYRCHLLLRSPYRCIIMNKRVGSTSPSRIDKQT